MTRDSREILGYILTTQFFTVHEREELFAFPLWANLSMCVGRDFQQINGTLSFLNYRRLLIHFKRQFGYYPAIWWQSEYLAF